MSLQFSDTSSYKGIVQVFEKEIGASYGDISGNTTKLKSFTADSNLAMDEFLEIGFGPSGMWQLDDSNHEKYPFIKTNIVSGQRDYAFTTDQQGNLILDIYRVMVADSNGVYREIYPVDQQTPTNNNVNTDTFIDGNETAGTPTRYDKTANGIFLDLVPNYSRTNGLKVFINREGSYFVYTDTTKKPGFPGTLHKWFALRPAQDYIRRNGTVAQLNKITIEVENMKAMIKQAFGRRQKDILNRMVANRENNK